MLLEYFGEQNVARCGNCDVCRKRNELSLSTYTFDMILKDLKQTLKSGDYSLTDLVRNQNYSEELVIKVLQFLIDNHKIIKTPDGLFRWHE